MAIPHTIFPHKPGKAIMVHVEVYGGRRGYLEHVRTRALYALGAYRSARDVDWAAVSRLVFVCKGNICRSPYASARARLLGVPSASFGLEAEEVSPADPAARRSARSRAVDLSAHRSARRESCRITDDDLIVVFEPSQLAEIRRLRAHRMSRATLLGIWAQPIRPHIQDPYGRSDRYFQSCFSIIDANIAELVRRMGGGIASQSSVAMETHGADGSLA
jgi:protein-tyrosine phosphatase